MSPDGGRLAYFSAHSSHLGHVYDTATGKAAGLLFAPRTGHIAGFSGDGGEAPRLRTVRRLTVNVSTGGIDVVDACTLPERRVHHVGG